MEEAKQQHWHQPPLHGPRRSLSDLPHRDDNFEDRIPRKSSHGTLESEVSESDVEVEPSASKREHCRVLDRVLKSSSYNIIAACATVFALFGDDFRLLWFPKGADSVCIMCLLIQQP